MTPMIDTGLAQQSFSFSMHADPQVSEAGAGVNN